jgi:hypothetical protein
MDPLLPLTAEFLRDLDRQDMTLEYRGRDGKVAQTLCSLEAPLSPPAFCDHLRTFCDGDNAWVTAVSRWAYQRLPAELLIGAMNVRQGQIGLSGGSSHWVYKVRRDAAKPFVEVTCSYRPGRGDPMRCHVLSAKNTMVKIPGTLKSAHITVHVYPPAGSSDDASAATSTRTYVPPTLHASSFRSKWDLAGR